MNGLPFHIPISALVALCIAGCGQTSDKAAAKSSAESPSRSAPADSKPVADVPVKRVDSKPVELKNVNCEQWDKDLATRKGKIVVVDTWATTCAPCVEEFPHLVALHGKYAKDGVACMSVSVDEPKDRAAALEFLQKKEATFANYFIDDPKKDAWWDKWEIRAIPIVLVFDRDGKLVRKFDKDDPDNQFTYEDVEKLVVELIGRQPRRS